MITPLDIENKRFSKQMMNGYNVEEVDDFLDELTVEYGKNYKEANELRAKVEELNNQIKEKLEELKKIKTKKETNDIISKNQLSIEKLKKKKNRLLRSLYWRVYRLKKAFPTLDTKEIREILEKKIEVIKKSQKK